MLAAQEQEWIGGEEQAWRRLAVSAPAEVCRRTGARFDECSGVYVLDMFNSEVEIHPGHRKIRGTGDLCDLLRNVSHYARLSIVWYLVQAQETPPSGNLISPRQLPGGLIYARGSHVLPLERLARLYGGDPGAFLKKGEALGGECRRFGDASVMLYPFPRVPVLLILWRKDDEFPAHAELLFDDTCSLHLPADIIWSTAMLSITVFL